MTVVQSPPLEIAMRDMLRTTYRFDELQIGEVLSGGMFGRPVLLHTNRGPFVLRTHVFRSTEQAFRFQAETIESAWRHGVSCSRVEPTEAGAWCIPMTSRRSVLALHRFVDGRCDDWLAWRHRKQAQSGFLYTLGQQVAELHNALASAQPGGEPCLDDALPPIQFDKLQSQYAGWRRSMDRLRQDANVASAETRQQFLSLGIRIDAHWKRLLAADHQHGLASLRRQIVHGDISPVNIVFGNGDRPAFIDWDCVHVGLRMYDALGDVLNRPPDSRPDCNRFSTDEVNEYVEGYASSVSSPLTEVERRLVPVFCLARQLEDLRQRMYSLPRLDISQDTKYARLIRTRVDMMDQIELK